MIKPTKHIWRKTLLASAISMTLGLSVSAEEIESKEAEQEESGNRTIVVTAQKRAQSVQDIAISITAIDSEALLEQGINDPTEFGKIIPNVAVRNVSGGGVPVVIVRGVGLQNFRINDSPTTSFYIDEVYQTSVASAEFSMYDLERVEVLKGPQGGLYGRNTIGGAIQIISTKPDVGSDNSGFVNLGFGTFKERELEFGVNVPVSDTSALRFSGRLDSSGDKDYFTAQDNQRFGESDRWGVRIQYLYEPSDDFNLLIKAHAGSMDVEMPLLQAVGLYNNIGNAAAFGLPNSSLGLISGLFGAGSAGLCQSILDGNGSDPTSCATLTGITPEDYGLTSSVYASAASGKVSQLDTQWSGFSMIAEFDLGGMTLTSISSSDSIDYIRELNADATPVVHQDIDYGSDITFWSQEFRLASAPNEAFNWIIGASYSEDKLVESTELFGGEGVLPAFFGGATSSKQDYVQKTDGYSVYGHSEYAFTSKLNFISELRFTEENKTFEGGATLGFPGGAIVPFLDIADSPAGDTKKFTALSGKLGLAWNMNDDVLLYGNLSRGFKTGGFFGGFATSIDHLIPFEEETINAIELGFKSDIMSNKLRINGSIFKYDRQDVQLNATDPSETVSIARLTNIGDIETTGAELDIKWVATENLKIILNLGYTDAFVSDSDFVTNTSLPLFGTTPLEGLNLPNYSKFSTNLIVRHEHEMGESLLGTAQFEYSYRSEQDMSFISNEEIEAPIFREPDYSLLNLRYFIEDRNSNWRVSLFVDNVTDKIYRTEVRPDGLFGVRQRFAEGRTAGIKYSYAW